MPSIPLPLSPIGVDCGVQWLRDHGCCSAVDRVDDLGVVDALEVDRRDAEVGVSELALDHDQRDAFVSHLDRVSVT
jgi:hypothetical protein